MTLLSSHSNYNFNYFKFPVRKGTVPTLVQCINGSAYWLVFMVDIYVININLHVAVVTQNKAVYCVFLYFSF